MPIEKYWSGPSYTQVKPLIFRFLKIMTVLAKRLSIRNDFSSDGSIVTVESTLIEYRERPEIE